MKLYRVEYDHEISSLPNEVCKKEFISAKIPNVTMGTENTTIPRICFSDSLENALRSAPFSLDMLKDFDEDEEIYVWVACIESDNYNSYIPNEKVKEYVPDAFITKEAWICEDIEIEYKLYKVVLFYLDEGEIDTVYLECEDVVEVLESWNKKDYYIEEDDDFILIEDIESLEKYFNNKEKIFKEQPIYNFVIELEDTKKVS